MPCTKSLCNSLIKTSKGVIEYRECINCLTTIESRFITYSSTNSLNFDNIPEIYERKCELISIQVYQDQVSKKIRRSKLSSHSIRVLATKDVKHPKLNVECTSGQEIRRSRIKDCHISSDLNIYSTLGLDNLNTSSKFQRRCSDRSRVSQSRASYSKDNKANILTFNPDNEQQSSSIPNVSCDLNCVNDERLDQPDITIIPNVENKHDTTKLFEPVFSSDNMIEASFSKEIDSDENDCNFSKFSEKHLQKEQDQNIISAFRSPKFSANKEDEVPRPKELSPVKDRNQLFKYTNLTGSKNDHTDRNIEKTKFNNVINTNYKNRLFCSKTLLNEIDSYYNASYVLKFNLEASPESAALPLTKMIENPILNMNRIFKRNQNKSILKNISSIKQSKISSNVNSRGGVGSHECPSQIKIQNCFETIQESVKNNNFKRCFSPPNQKLKNLQKFSRNVGRDVKNMKSLPRQINTREICTSNTNKPRFKRIKQKRCLHVNMLFKPRSIDVPLNAYRIKSPVLRVKSS